jgi:hypothetical protein
MNRIARFIFILVVLPLSLQAQSLRDSLNLWHNQQRALRYYPDGEDFIIKNGSKRFTRALYGTNTAFRVEAGDLPEFAMYFPGMGGNIQFGLACNGRWKWLNQAQTIEARYKPGAMIYEIKDSILGDGFLSIHLLAMSDAEGMIMQIKTENCLSSLSVIAIFGGASNKRFSRNGDIGADPESSFYLKPENCVTNTFALQHNRFDLTYGSSDTLKQKKLIGVFPESSNLQLADASKLDNLPELLESNPNKYPVLLANIKVKASAEFYIAIQNPENRSEIRYFELPDIFNKAENARKELAERVKVVTPDSFINTFGGALSVAADAIWDGISYQHGAIAWRMPLNGWRGAYVADPLGWHDRAKMHFRGYAQAQYLSSDSGPCVPDPEKNMARQKEEEGVSLYTNGYISRSPGKLSKPHHYDMNLVFIDQLLTHFKWTGDTAFVREMWPVIKRHLAWEKRNFDRDGDGLYDAYCCIWASDALQYSGGGVTHSSAYNYRANKMAAYLAGIIGEDSKPFKEEAAKILKAIQNNLWIENLGWYAEYKDLLGLKLVHHSAGLWTVYHTIDSDVPNSFEKYQTLRYVDTRFHIPIIIEGLKDEKYYTLSTTNWMPYTWSVNNVVFAELLHTALAYWQGGRVDNAFKLWKSSILESMYLGSSAGNFQQISSYDAFRGELYRDFADPIGIAARTLVEGLFGIIPDALTGDLYIRPGLPAYWDHASLHIPDVDFVYKSEGDIDFYTIAPRFNKPMRLTFSAFARKDGVKAVYVNGRKIIWRNVEDAIEKPKIEFSFEPADTFKIRIEWSGSIPSVPGKPVFVPINDSIIINTRMGQIMEVYDPQSVTQNLQIEPYQLKTKIIGEGGNKTIFIKVDQNQMSWWQPIDFKAANMIPEEEFQRKYMRNNDEPEIQKNLNGQHPHEYKTLDLSKYFNDKVTQIFLNKYLSPRPNVPTLQLPVQGIGNWCYPNVQPDIDDSGLRTLAGNKGIITLPNGVFFKTPGDKDAKNIIFTSQWDNYPDSYELPLSGKASHAYLLMAGSTNPMQSQMVNGIVLFKYTDGSADSLELINPQTWWPIEQDYYVDKYAFQLHGRKPLRVHLKTGLITRDFKEYSTIKGFTSTAIDGGAATVFGLPLNPAKKLKKLILKTYCNDVVIGLMGVTLQVSTP